MHVQVKISIFIINIIITFELLTNIFLTKKGLPDEKRKENSLRLLTTRGMCGKEMWEKEINK